MTNADSPDIATDDLELEESAGPAASGAAASVARSRSSLLGPLRWLLRGVLLVVCVASLVVGWWGRRPGGVSTIDQDWGLVVTLDEGPNYGEAVVYLGDPATGKTFSDDVELQQALQSALAAAGSPRVLVQAAPGVSMAAVDRVQNILRAAQAAQTVDVSLGLYEPPANQDK